MTFDELERASILILGFGREGQATYEFIRRRWPEKAVTIADARPLEQMTPCAQGAVASDRFATLRFGDGYMEALSECEVIVKTPGIPGGAVRRELEQRGNNKAIVTSHSAVFLANFPRQRIIGITGTKGKSTTTSLIFEILRKAGLDARLAGNIGAPPLPMLRDCTEQSFFVHEFSSHQLVEARHSPHIAVLLNIAPEHLDYYSDFEEYRSAKENITRFQTSDDFLVYNADYAEPRGIAARTKARLVPFSMSDAAAVQEARSMMKSAAAPLLGDFNVQNVLAAIAASRLLNVPAEAIRRGIQEFRPLPHRLEFVGVFRGIRFYDDSIATTPEAALAAVDAIGPDVTTLILGGHERNLDFTELGRRLALQPIETLILFPPTGERIWQAVRVHQTGESPATAAFFVDTMEQAVRIAYERTAPGKTCLLSPASASFGIFKDYADRGDSFKQWVRKLA